jgi:hypothetical protein
MPIITKSKSSYISPRFVAMSPYEVYLNQVKGAIDNIRFTAQGMSYSPPQLGGLDGQLNVITQAVVLQITDFSVGS